MLLAAALPPERTRALVGLGFARTDPEAVETLVERGAEVRLFLGHEDLSPESFHPKLYMISTRNGLMVFSGSANLTSGGLVDNVEQFEELLMSGPGRAAQMRRFRTIWAWGAPFEEVVASGAWALYKDRYRSQNARRERLDATAEHLTAEVREMHARSAPHDYAPREWHELRPARGSQRSPVPSPVSDPPRHKGRGNGAAT